MVGAALIGLMLQHGTAHLSARAWKRGITLAAAQILGWRHLAAGNVAIATALIVGAVVTDVVGALWAIARTTAVAAELPPGPGHPLSDPRRAISGSVGPCAPRSSCPSSSPRPPPPPPPPPPPGPTSWSSKPRTSFRVFAEFPFNNAGGCEALEMLIEMAARTVHFAVDERFPSDR